MQVTLYFASYPPENYTKELRMFWFFVLFFAKNVWIFKKSVYLCRMTGHLFFLGILTGLCLGIAAHFIHTRQHKAPYRLAFGLMAAYVFVMECVVNGIEMFSETTLPYSLKTTLDFMVFPLYLHEVICLVNQDVEAMTWRKRGMLTAASAIPLALYLLYSLATNDQSWQLSSIFLLLYGASILAIVTYLQIRYQHMLHKVNGKKKQEIWWIWSTTAGIVLQGTSYAFYESLPTVAIYYFFFYATLIIHAFYLSRQTPTDTTKMQEEIQKGQEKVLEEREKALEDLKGVAENLKKQSEMETTLKTFKVSYPQYEQALREAAETRLTQRDIYLCVLIYQNQRIPEIAECLSISPASVEVARYRLRSKFGLDKGDNLNKFIKELISG